MIIPKKANIQKKNLSPPWFFVSPLNFFSPCPQRPFVAHDFSLACRRRRDVGMRSTPSCTLAPGSTCATRRAAPCCCGLHAMGNSEAVTDLVSKMLGPVSCWGRWIGERENGGFFVWVWENGMMFFFFCDFFENFRLTLRRIGSFITLDSDNLGDFKDEWGASKELHKFI